MDALFWLVPLAIVLGGCFAAAFLWAVRAGQFDDLDDAPVRMLRGEEEER
jgi:cbb3-type cytochrome oxidase maturation protein